MLFSRLLTINARCFRFMAVILFAPLILSACYFDEIAQEQYSIDFESDGSIRVVSDVEGSLSDDWREASVEERSEMLAIASERVEVMLRDLFGNGFVYSELNFDDPDLSTAGFEGRFPPEADVPSNTMGVFRLARPEDGLWELYLVPDNFRHPLNVCITLGTNWGVLEQPRRFPPVSPGETQCGNWTELQDGYPADVLRLVRLDDDGMPMDDRPGVEETLASLEHFYGVVRADTFELLSVEVPATQRAIDLPLDNEHIRFSIELRARENLVRTYEEIDGTYILGPAAAEGEVATFYGTYEWGWTGRGWELTRTNFDDREAFSRFGFSERAIEGANWAYVLDGTPEADALRASQPTP